MKSFIAALTVCLLLLSSQAADAQTRRRRTNTPQRRTPASSSASRLGTTQANAARIRLGDQIKNLTRFIYLYGRFSKDLELTGAQAEASANADRTKAALIDSLRNVREGLDQLEAQFRLTPGLESQYRRLSGVARTAEEAENRVAANQLDQAGRMLIEVVNKLTDVLLDM